jgi:hypothetical protein
MAEEKTSRAHSAMSGGSKKSSKKSKTKKHPKEIHIRRGKSGGFIAKHIHDADPNSPDTAPEPDEEHVLPDLEALHSHMDANMGDQAPVPQAAPSPDMSQAGPAAAGAAAPGPGGPPAPAPQQGM